MKLEEIKERTATGKGHLTGGKPLNIVEHFYMICKTLYVVIAG